jgi:hypothetical protein
LDLDALTGLTSGQRLVLYGQCRELIGAIAKPSGRPPVLDLYRSIMMVVCLMRKNNTQEFTGAIFGASQSTVSRRWDLLRPIVRRAVASFIPHPRQIVGSGTALVDGTITPTWNWNDIPDLFSKKAGYTGMNIQIAANLNGDIAAIGPLAVHGARHDAHAFKASGLKKLLAEIPAAGDLGYVGVEGIQIIPIKRAAKCDLRPCDDEFNKAFNGIRAAIERAVATLKTWRMLSQEGGRYRAPIEKFEETQQAIIGLVFFRAFA